MTMPEPTPAPPAAVPTVRQTVPADLPFSVRLSGTWRHLLRPRRAETVMYYVFALVMVPAGVYFLLHSDETVHSSRYGDMNSGLLGIGAILLGVGGAVVLPITAARQLRPVPLAADAHGVYVRPNLDPKRVLHLPWEHIESIQVRSWHGPQLCVKPRDARIEPQFNLAQRGDASARAGVAVAQKRRMKKLGTNIHVPIGTSGQTPDELLAGLRYQAAGRVPVGS